jgi:peptidoglycan hydrolase-like protein with peptidoglycan-binding domain
MATPFNDDAWLTSVGEAAYAAKDYKKATIFFATSNHVKPSKTVYERALESLGLALGVPVSTAVAFDPTQGRREATPALKSAVQVFQADNELTADGIAGTTTLAKFVPEGDIVGLILESATYTSPK